MFLITDMFIFPRGHRTSTCPLGQELTTLILIWFRLLWKSRPYCSVEDYSPSRSPTKTSYICRLELENSVFLHLVLLRFTPVASNSYLHSGCTIKYMFLNFSTQLNSIGQRNLYWKTALESLFNFHVPVFRTKQGAWHKRIRLNYKLSPTYPRLAIFSLRELHQTSPSTLRAETSFRYQSDPPCEPNLSHKRRGCQLSLLSINFDFRNVIFQPIVFPLVWAKYKWNFMRDLCKLSFPLPLAASPLARAFSQDSFHSPK